MSTEKLIDHVRNFVPFDESRHASCTLEHRGNLAKAVAAVLDSLAARLDAIEARVAGLEPTPTPSPFKVGDEVEHVENGWRGTVTAVDADGRLRLRQGARVYGGHDLTRFRVVPPKVAPEPVKPEAPRALRVGDRVRVVKVPQYANDDVKGRVGTISGPDRRWDWRVVFAEPDDAVYANSHELVLLPAPAPEPPAEDALVETLARVLSATVPLTFATEAPRLADAALRFLRTEGRLREPGEKDAVREALDRERAHNDEHLARAEKAEAELEALRAKRTFRTRKVTDSDAEEAWDKIARDCIGFAGAGAALNALGFRKVVKP